MVTKMERNLHWPAPEPATGPPLSPNLAPGGPGDAGEHHDGELPGLASGPTPHGHNQSWLRRRLGAALAAIVAVAAKFKAILLLLPKIKLLVTAGSMLVSIAAYATIWGWQFGVGVVALIFVHEMGHVIQMRREGVPASPPMFIPFLGAIISARSLGDDALAEARVGLAGPILGSVGAAVCVGIWHATGNDLFRALAYFGFLINFFNLLPVVPLDGGRAMAAMAPWMWFVGFLALIPLVFVFSSPFLLIIILFAGYETYNRWRRLRRGGEREQRYYRVRPVNRLLVAAVYIALVALLVVGMHTTYLHRTLG